MSEDTVRIVRVGDIVRHKSMGDDAAFDVKVLEIGLCGAHGDHPCYEILDPETGEPDAACSLDFDRVG